MSTESEGIAVKKRRTRIEPEMRRKAIIEATMQCITRYGHSGSTLERICAQAGVSIGPDRASLFQQGRVDAVDLPGVDRPTA
ncbi:TetR/AcrR family transcriptional regulator [Pseudomonas azotoformans]|uniref:TetR/AcrR family transcriptional regulator n=1 Tax=Pseudomonas azotoformans TaxID=47878 RepID=UPI0012E70E51|nr:hypothetical protein [Pseudomonas azotoformans]